MNDPRRPEWSAGYCAAAPAIDKGRRGPPLPLCPRCPALSGAVRRARAWPTDHWRASHGITGRHTIGPHIDSGPDGDGGSPTVSCSALDPLTAPAPAPVRRLAASQARFRRPVTPRGGRWWSVSNRLSVTDCGYLSVPSSPADQGKHRYMFRVLERLAQL